MLVAHGSVTKSSVWCMSAALGIICLILTAEHALHYHEPVCVGSWGGEGEALRHDLLHQH